MKIGILTFHRALNYGAVLQAYALQQMLLKLPADVEVIDYLCPKIEKQYRSLLGIGTMKDHISHLLQLVQFWKRDRKFFDFIRRRMILSPQCFDSREKLHSISSEYDFFVTGSDQVWNAFLTGFDKTYLLDFVGDSRKKVSYAASFGLSKLPEAWEAPYRTLLKSFSALSVRERQGADIIRDLNGQNAQVNVDPVFLIPADQWEQIAAPVAEKNYIFVYLMARSQTIFSFIERLSAKTGCSVIWFSPGVRRPVPAKYIRAGGPEDFLGYLANASYVVTNSFHGTAFSILFHKKFFVEYLPEQRKMNSRLEQVLNLFHLEGRLIQGISDLKMPEEINYDSVERILEEERNRSLQFFKDAFGVF